MDKHRSGEDGEVGAALVVVGLSADRVAREAKLRDDMIRVAHRTGASLRQLADVSGLGRKTVTAIVSSDSDAVPNFPFAAANLAAPRRATDSPGVWSAQCGKDYRARCSRQSVPSHWLLAKLDVATACGARRRVGAVLVTWIRRHQWTRRSPSEKTGIRSPSGLSVGMLTKPAGSFGTCRGLPPTRHMRVRGGTGWRHCDADDMGLRRDVGFPVVEWIDLPEGGVSFFTDRPNDTP